MGKPEGVVPEFLSLLHLHFSQQKEAGLARAEAAAQGGPLVLTRGMNRVALCVLRPPRPESSQPQGNILLPLLLEQDWKRTHRLMLLAP